MKTARMMARYLEPGDRVQDAHGGVRTIHEIEEYAEEKLRVSFREGGFMDIGARADVLRVVE